MRHSKKAYVLKGIAEEKPLICPITDDFLDSDIELRIRVLNAAKKMEVKEVVVALSSPLSILGNFSIINLILFVDIYCLIRIIYG